jgi:hypothetical protein
MLDRLTTFKGRVQNLPSLDELLNEISHDQYLSRIDQFLPSAWVGHAPFLKFLIRELKPNLFVELGVHNGFSYFIGCQSIQECSLSTKAFAVDHWLGDSQAGYFDEKVFQDVLTLNRRYSGFSHLLKMSFEEALDKFEDSSIDLLHIDGFHSYESVKRDFESWLRKMSPNAIILLHDIHVRIETYGVHLFWKELKKIYNTIEFVGSHGLGLVFLGEIPEGKIAQLVEISENGEFSQVEGTFGSISSNVLQSASNFLSERTIVERDRAIAERDIVLNSTTWRIFKPYRWLRHRIKL